MRQPINSRFFLTEVRAADKPALVAHLNDREIYEWTLRIPLPYTEVDADKFLAITNSAFEQYGEPIHFAIRDLDEKLIGGCGLDGLVKCHRAELGYWLARPFRGQGIMSAAVGIVFDHLALQRYERRK